MNSNGNDGLCGLSDEDVVLLAQSGNEEAANHIVARYRNDVYRKANTYFLAGAETEDIAQEGMIGLYNAVKDYRCDCGSSFRHFALLCITRQMITAVRMAGRKKHMPLNSYISLDKDSGIENDAVPFLEDEENNPENIVISRESFGSMERSINSLLSKLELQVLMYYTEGMSYDEIAELTGKKRKSVDNAVQRIKKKLAGSLDNRL